MRPVAPGRGKPRKVRQPWPINLRVLLFFVLLAALGAAVWVILQNAPDSTPTTPTVVAPLETTVDTTGATDATDSTVAPSAPSTAPLASLLPSTTVLGPIGPSTTINDFAPGPEPSTTST